ncbi:bifunctional 4-hydroxy-2-oxoglutarate aldolase/2-dehydro-3-deoxy-phosphogluconate aldolase [Mucilaginibacter achroorhodeus]|uniref:Bifunctional 4-hydroxy-2-oxoglutarate aldolase/2-dehydro-3-deoxy-phosphogluconate aldolase n=1 Tax=Mucilaginibacter achroorhodeus TaxID=2599294 RepID=A0A563U2M5_9SPHI|nr:bifunctional 4-hydroxy-2-oxoglutarate aldolase/2-dehydro-3-deoxy-phosphogluconate aldolase [Mucilaginibacter achroorhodeus]TWR25597.1 bifunctional 4-hydroxy-2-oxoglutarate aldolase/2-dehydro-3-deoxy-phosphogluconate aldolase [Mucilaginibacter achroorhodeus]
MKSKQEITDAIITQGMLPLFYHADKQVSLDAVKTLYKAGIRVIEYTNRGVAALENFKVLKQLQQTELPDLILGIGTIKTPQDFDDYAFAGADFFISPVVAEEVGHLAITNNYLWIPGCMTPTEIDKVARYFDVSFVKLFPANVLGPGFVSAVKELFPGVKMMPTGGVDMSADNISSWFKAGVVAVGMGSKLISPQLLNEKNYNQLYTDTLHALELVKEAR